MIIIQKILFFQYNKYNKVDHCDFSRFFVYASMRDPKKWTEDTRENLKLIQMDVASEDSVNSAVSSIESMESRSIDIGVV